MDKRVIKCTCGNRGQNSVITAFQGGLKPLMCWSNTKIDRRNFLTRISGIFNQLETVKKSLESD